MSKLKPYMIYSAGAGPEEGAMLVFAHSVREARKIGWQQGGNDLTSEYIDLAANILRDCPWLYVEADQIKLLNDEPHLVWNIRFCEYCGQWGQSEIGEDGLCEECRDIMTESESR